MKTCTSCVLFSDYRSVVVYIITDTYIWCSQTNWGGEENFHIWRLSSSYSTTAKQNRGEESKKSQTKNKKQNLSTGEQTQEERIHGPAREEVRLSIHYLYYNVVRVGLLQVYSDNLEGMCPNRLCNINTYCTIIFLYHCCMVKRSNGCRKGWLVAVWQILSKHQQLIPDWTKLGPFACSQSTGSLRRDQWKGAIWMQAIGLNLMWFPIPTAVYRGSGKKVIKKSVVTKHN